MRFRCEDDADGRRPMLRVGETEEDRRCMAGEVSGCGVRERAMAEERRTEPLIVVRSARSSRRSASPDPLLGSGSEVGSHSAPRPRHIRLESEFIVPFAPIWGAAAPRRRYDKVTRV